MSWDAWTAQLAASGFCGAAIIDRNSYAVLAQHGDCIPRGYKVPQVNETGDIIEGQEVDVNENSELQKKWDGTTTSVRFNQIKYMVFPDRSNNDNDFLRGKKGDKSIYLYKLKTIFLVAVADSSKLSAEQGQVVVGGLADSLKTSGC